MKETLEQELVDLATEIIAYQGRLNLSELSQKRIRFLRKSLYWALSKNTTKC